jgi:rhodanese-related sulfurtransferase
MKFILAFVLFFTTTFCFSQNTISKVLEKFNTKTVPYITIEELKSNLEYVLLDARETKEFNVSHIENAINVGFNKYDGKKIAAIVPDKNTTIVVYCSIGVRSEIIGEKLKKLGYKNVLNLYGGIFEWKNQACKTVNSKNIQTDSIHTFNKEWSKYLKKGVKIYED